MASALDIASLLLTATGVLVTAYGVRASWREFAPKGEGILDPPKKWARGVGRRLTARLPAIWARITGSPTNRQIIVGDAALGFSTAFNAKVLIQYGTLPPGQDPAEAIAALDARTRELVLMIARVDDRLSEEVAADRTQTAALDQALKEAVDRLDDKTRQAAIGGIRIEALGLFLIGAGALLQLVAAVIG